MYRKGFQGWMKHYDFILIDMICLQLAFVAACLLRNYGANPYGTALYRSMAIALEIVDLLVIFFFETLKNVVKRGIYQEFTITVKHVMLVTLLSVLYLFSIQQGQQYSRTVLFVTAGIYLVISYVTRVGWKHILRRKMTASGKRSLLLVADARRAPEVIKNIRRFNFERFNIAGLVIMDRDMTGEIIEDVPVVANVKNASAYACREWVDELMVVPDIYGEYPKKLVDKFMEMGITVHVDLDTMTQNLGKTQMIERIGNYTVLTGSINCATGKQAFTKRAIDILGGLVGCIFTGIIFIFVAPAIYISSPGPIFFAQVRIGKNGKKFKMYKFRSMYMDAEERKKELMAQNRVSDGKMFKLDFDPRVIGNKILPDGTKKTGIGNFIRVTSLDEFPQFFNVLKGDMSLVGTRPPTEDEWETYDLHHRARLAMKPGITGMWQVSGRSQITDFEEVVKLDTKYIREWSMGLDFEILFKTVLAVLKREGSM